MERPHFYRSSHGYTVGGTHGVDPQVIHRYWAISPRLVYIGYSTFLVPLLCLWGLNCYWLWMLVAKLVHAARGAHGASGARARSGAERKSKL